MKTVRIYKDDIRVNIVRSLLLTDTVLSVMGGLFLAGLLFGIFQYTFRPFQLGYYLSVLFVLELSYIAILTQKIDNQPISSLIPRALRALGTPKKQRAPRIDPYFTNFTVQDNMIVRPDSLIRIFELEPYDISLLNEQDREHFFLKLKQLIHILPSQIQLIVKKERATIDDYTQHMFSLYSQSSLQTELLLSRYITDLTRFIETNEFNRLKYYAVFSVRTNTRVATAKIAGVTKLNNSTLRFSHAASAANVTVRPLLNDELIHFMKEELR